MIRARGENPWRFSVSSRFCAAATRSSSGCPTNETRSPARWNSSASNGSTTARRLRAIDQLVNSTAPPRPHLRRNIVEHRNAVAPRGAGENQVELRIVNQDQKVRLLAPDDLPQCAKRADRPPNRRCQLRKSKPVDVLHLDDRAHAGRAHFLARNSEQLARRIARENFPRQIAAMKIARRLAGNDHDSASARGIFQALVKPRWRFGIRWHRSDCD